MEKVIRWFDSHATVTGSAQSDPDRIEPIRWIPFALMHGACLLVFVVGWSPVAVLVAVLLYLIRMFAITAFYHRYFSHRSFKTSRVVQFIFAFIGATAVQRGPLWWAGHHRQHHQTVDTQNDPHSPKIHGFLHSHMLWFLTNRNVSTPMDRVKDWRKFPELIWLDRFDLIPPIGLAVGLWLLGGWQMVVWGIVSTVFLYHGTYTINSFCHLYGSRRYNTPDTSRNSLFFAIITLGEGWHNNHHRYAVSTRQGFFPHEIDITYYILQLMKKIGLIRDIRPVPESLLKGDVT